MFPSPTKPDPTNLKFKYKTSKFWSCVIDGVKSGMAWSGVVSVLINDVLKKIKLNKRNFDIGLSTFGLTYL